MEKLTIKAVAEITGISEFTLRSWEKRYSAIAPKRNTSGRRLYNLEEVEKLRLLNQLRLRGHAIKDIAPLSISKLGRLVHAAAEQSNGRQHFFVSEKTPSVYVNLLAQELIELNLSKFTSLLKRTQLEFDTRTYLIDIVSPLLKILGDKVVSGELDVFHEHTASAIVRNSLSALLYASEQFNNLQNQTPIIFCSPEGDLHEFGILICAVLAVLNGFQVFYLGPNLPAESVVRAAQVTSSPLVVVGLSAPRSVLKNSEIHSFLNTTLASLPDSTMLWYGGMRAFEVELEQTPRVRLIQNLKFFDQALRLWQDKMDV
ncbi:MerR family transcriptional regulator [Bdellovibrio bacteriovorus]